MSEERAKRKLSGILSADAVGYSRLMQDDEAATILTLADSKQLMADLIQQYRGRVVDAPGDNLLAEFGSVVDATECAVKLQQELKTKNADRPENRKMPFRIGINLGDVVEDDDRIYGDGVNIAARLEGLAEPGGICISRTAYDHVKNKLELGYEYLGEHSVKNIAEPVRVYKVLMEPEAAGKVIGEKRSKPIHWTWAAAGGALVLILVAGIFAIWNFYFRPAFEPASIEKMAFPLPDKPSIAVLPFDSLSADPKSQSLADRISESIIYTLSYIPDMLVISRNSTFTYKGKPVKIKQVAEELGVRYVLEGSIMEQNDQVRVTAQLIDATDGYHVWSGRYDRTMNDFFEMLDEITKTIAIELQANVSGKLAHLTRKANNFDAWAYANHAYGLVTRLGKENLFEGHRLTEKAVELDSTYGFAWAVLAAAHTLEAAFGYSESPAESLKRAFEFNDKALELDPTLACATGNRGQIYLLQGKIDEAIVFGKKAIAMAPNLDTNYALLSGTMRYAGRFDESIPLMQKAMRLNPFYPAIYLTGYGSSLLMAKRYEEALVVYKELLNRAQKGEFPRLFAHLGLSVAYAEIGNEESAKSHVSKILEGNPNFSLEGAAKLARYKDPRHTEQWFTSLRKAGLPEHPPLKLPDKPSIAVLPFDNLSADPKQAYLADGITENIISALARAPELFVIASNSTFTYKGKAVKIQKIARDLGVRYVVEGSVQRAGDRLRIVAQLVDASDGKHLWADKYDRVLADIFTLEDEITMQIIIALQVKLTQGEKERIGARGTTNLEAYLKKLQGDAYRRSGTKEDNARAQQLYQEAIALDPEYATVYGLLGWVHVLAARFGWSKSRSESMQRALELAHKANVLDENHVAGSSLLSYIYRQKKHYEKAIAEAERLIDLEPNNAAAYTALAVVLYPMGRGDEAVGLVKKAIRLDPIPPWYYFYYLGNGYLVMEQYDEAITAYKEALHRKSNNWIARVPLTACFIFMDREDEAYAEAAEVLRLNPKFSVDYWVKRTSFKDKSFTERYASALRKAGLK